MGRPTIPLKLSKKDKESLKSYLSVGKKSARSIKRGMVLKLLDEGIDSEKIVEVVGISMPTIIKTKKRYNEGGLQAALCEKPRPGQPKTIGPKEEAHVTAIACSDPPLGRKRWTINLIRDEVIELGYVENISRESVRKILKKATLNLG